MNTINKYIDLYDAGKIVYLHLKFPDGSGQIIFDEYINNSQKLIELLSQWYLNWKAHEAISEGAKL